MYREYDGSSTGVVIEEVGRSDALPTYLQSYVESMTNLYLVETFGVDM